MINQVMNYFACNLKDCNELDNSKTIGLWSNNEGGNAKL
ncbi:hypothetical protein GAPWKB11_1859 [Gilliamella apicola]|jgi:hypothetical protein|nr:hypothetical protein GAPWKB11_1859 [Gilliamella apicola]